MNNGPVAVLGANGKTGRAVLSALTRRGVPARAVVHDLSRAPDGVPAAAADLATGRGLHAALAGCEAVYLLAPNMFADEPALVTRVLDAAAAAGVDRVVYHSVAQPYVPSMPHHVDKARSEDLVRRSGSRWTVLQPAAYVQNLVDQLRQTPPALSVPYSADARFSLVDLADVGEAAAVVLSQPGHLGATYELGGPDALCLHDVASVAGRVLGVPVRVTTTTPQEWEGSPAAAALDPDTRARLAAMFDYYDRYGLLAGSLVLRTLLGRAPSGVAEVIGRELTRR